MKVTTNKPEPTFKPVSLTITFETQQELDAFGSLFNCVPVGDAFDKEAGEVEGCDRSNIIYESARQIGADIHNVDPIVKSLKQYILNR